MCGHTHTYTHTHLQGRFNLRRALRFSEPRVPWQEAEVCACVCVLGHYSVCVIVCACNPSFSAANRQVYLVTEDRHNSIIPLCSNHKQMSAGLSAICKCFSWIIILQNKRNLSDDTRTFLEKNHSCAEGLRHCVSVIVQLADGYFLFGLFSFDC